MVNVIYAAHRKGGREYIWRIPENMQVNVQDWAVVRTQYGICIVQVQRLGEVDDAEAEKLESVLQAVSDRAMLPVPDPKKKSSSARKRRKRAARAAEKEKKRWAECGMDITPYWNKGFTTPQLDEIRKGLLIGIDVSQYADPSLLPGKMKKKRWAMIRPLAKFMGYLPDGLSKEQAKEILLGIESRVDVKQYADPSLSWKMMRLQRRCMEAGLDGAELKGKTRKELAACLRAQTDTGAGKAAGAETKSEEAEPSSVSEPTVGKTEPGSENAKPVHRRGEAESIIRAYQAAHPQATRNEAARATGYTWATVNKFWSKEEKSC
ncbi:MAG: hypothetical protein ACLTU3_07915 [Acutalibacteraceae bacterium]